MEEEWQTECSGLGPRYGALRKRELWMDCAFIVGAEQVAIKAHRLVLAAASPVFATMMYGSLAEQEDQHAIAIIDLEVNTFNMLLEYVYTYQIKLKTCEEASSLYYAAQKYMLPHLQKVCGTYILENINPTNVLSMFEFSHVFEEEEIKNTCLDVMTKATSDVLDIGHLELASERALLQLTLLDRLNLKSEMELLKALDWYNVANGSPQSVTPQLSDESATKLGDENEEQSFTIVRKALKNIRFLSIPKEEFATTNLTTLLSQSELLAILLNVISEKAYMPMPEGFSESHENRCFKASTSRVIITSRTSSECYPDSDY